MPRPAAEMAYIPKNARWYLADVVLEHAVEGDPRNVVHVNLHLIEAESPERAYQKAIALGQASEQVYANPDGREVRVTFRGLRDLNVIHDEGGRRGTRLRGVDRRPRGSIVDLVAR